jgi:hypothetical protein
MAPSVTPTIQSNFASAEKKSTQGFSLNLLTRICYFYPLVYCLMVPAEELWGSGKVARQSTYIWQTNQFLLHPEDETAKLNLSW